MTYFNWLRDEHGGNDGNDERGEPFLDFFVSELDPVGPQEEDGRADRDDHEEPRNEAAPPRKAKLLFLSDLLKKKNIPGR